MKRLLITGASGFIGSLLVEEGLRNGFEVWAAIRKTSSKKWLRDSRINFIYIDFKAEDLFEELTNQDSEAGRLLVRYPPHWVIHAAGLTTAPNEQLYQRVNALATEAFARALLQIGGLEHFLFLSSLAAYGPADLQPTDKVLLNSDPYPLTMYGRSKLAAEKLLWNLPNLPYTILRPTAVYGPRERDLFILFNLINKGIETYIGRQPQKLTFIHAFDLVRVIYATLQTKPKRQAYFAAYPDAHDSTELGHFIKSTLGKRTLKVRVPIQWVRPIATANEWWSALSRKSATLNREKLAELSSLNWQCEHEPLWTDSQIQPQYNLESGIQQTVAWYLEHNWL